MEIYGTKTRTSLQSQYQRNLLHCDISLPINVHLHIISIFYYNVRDSSKRPSRLHQGSRSTDWCHPILSSGKPHRNKATKLNSVGMQIQWMNKTATFDNQMDWSLQVAYSLRRRKFLPCSPKPHPQPPTRNSTKIPCWSHVSLVLTVLTMCTQMQSFDRNLNSDDSQPIYKPKKLTVFEVICSPLRTPPPPPPTTTSTTTTTNTIAATAASATTTTTTTTTTTAANA